MNRQERRKLEKQVEKANKRRKRYGMKTYDITEKLDFESNPKIKIKNVTVEVNTEAKNVIKAVSYMDKEGDLDGIMKAYDLLFDEKDREKIDKLGLNAGDFMAVLRTALSLAIGNDPDEEEKNE